MVPWWGKEVEIVSDLCGKIKEKQVLEIGGGTGRFSIELAKKGANVTSLDPAKAMLMVTREKMLAKYRVNHAARCFESIYKRALDGR